MSLDGVWLGGGWVSPRCHPEAVPVVGTAVQLTVMGTGNVPVGSTRAECHRG